jgi:hypothetical protein
MIKLFGLTMMIGLATSVQTVVSGVVFLGLGGVGVVRVEAPDVNLYLPIPTHLADAGLLVARATMPDEARAELRQELEPWLPLIQQVTDAIADVPNGSVLVSVETADEKVLIQKSLGRFTVDVDAEDANVHVSLPARSVKRIARQLGMLI